MAICAECGLDVTSREHMEGLNGIHEPSPAPAPEVKETPAPAPSRTRKPKR